MNRYKSAMKGISQEDEVNIPYENKFLTLPNMLICSTNDYAARAELQEQRHRKWTKKTRVEILDCGHWIQLEKREDLFRLLISFADEVADLKDTLS